MVFVASYALMGTYVPRFTNPSHESAECPSPTEMHYRRLTSLWAFALQIVTSLPCSNGGHFREFTMS